ncbi:MAG TPA: restriction endonuclease subunit S [Candidatus Wallbacteria bacterium]|nr:restriction endonuclease subunit S [Candidatus Wallbacteria bacterium]
MNKVPKGYKQTEVGVIPETWDFDKLGQIAAKIASGKSKIKSESDTYPLYGSTGMIGYSKNFDYEGEKILVARVGANAGTVNRVDGKYSVSDNTLIVDLKKDYNFSYIFYFLRYFNPSKMIFGSGQPLVTGSQLKNIEIAFPLAKTEQSAIAEALSDVDALISSLDELIAKKRNIKQGAMQELLTGKRRLPGFSGKWEEKRMGDCFNFSGGYSASREQLSQEGYCYLHYGDIHGSSKTFIDVDEEYSEIPKLKIDLKKISKKSFLCEGDVVFVDASEDDEGASRHIVIFNSNAIPYISGLHTIVSKSKNNLIDNNYKRYCFQSDYVKSQFKFYAAGTKVTGISKTNIAKIFINLPPTLEEQSAIAAVLSDMDAEIEQLEEKRDKYKQVKQGMMQELLTGKKRLI